MLAHLAQEYCKATITEKLLAATEFEKPWDQATLFGIYITQLETLCQKSAETGKHINGGRMALNITANAMRCPIFTQIDHKAYSNLGDHKLATVKAFWIKKNEAHTKYTREQAGNNNYESTAATNAKPPSKVTGNDYDTYILALEDIIAQHMAEKEDVLAVTTRVTPRPIPTAALNPTVADLMADIKKEMAALIEAAIVAAAITTGRSRSGRIVCNGGRRQRKPAYRKDKNGKKPPKMSTLQQTCHSQARRFFQLAKKHRKDEYSTFHCGKFVKKAE